MRKLGLAAVLAASIAATGCSTYPNQYGYDPYGYNNGYSNNGYYNNGYWVPGAWNHVGVGFVPGRDRFYSDRDHDRGYAYADRDNRRVDRDDHRDRDRDGGHFRR